jgi:hypothetical protein
MNDQQPTDAGNGSITLDELNPGLALIAALMSGLAVGMPARIVATPILSFLLGGVVSITVVGLYARSWCGSWRDAAGAWALTTAVLAAGAATYQLLGGARLLGLR